MRLYDKNGRAMRLTPPPRLAGLAAGTPHNPRARRFRAGEEEQ